MTNLFDLQMRRLAVKDQKQAIKLAKIDLKKAWYDGLEGQDRVEVMCVRNIAYAIASFLIAVTAGISITSMVNEANHDYTRRQAEITSRNCLETAMRANLPEQTFVDCEGSYKVDTRTPVVKEAEKK